MSRNDAEIIARAKRDVDLPGWLGTFGWVADPKHDAPRDRCLVRGPYESRLIVSIQPDGHWTFFRTADGKGGSIFDAAALFADARTFGQQMAAARRALASPPAPLPVIYTSKTKGAGETIVRPTLRGPLDDAGRAYLRDERHLAEATIETFSHALLSTSRGVQAGHNERGGEERGPDKWKSFSGGHSGEGLGRSLWIAVPCGNLRPAHIIVAESYIDAMSAWEMLPPPQRPLTAVASTGGALCPGNLAKLARALARAPGAEVLDCTDQGEKTTGRRTAQLQIAAEHAGASYTRHAPPGAAKDWNDALTAAWAASAGQEQSIAGYLPAESDQIEDDQVAINQ